jgi:hypothetical protein
MNFSAALCSAKSWIVEQGWTPENFSVKVSDLQSCPFGFVNIDIICTEASDANPLRSSRVLEVEISTGKIETVLAARDPEKLKKMVDLERVKVKTELMQAELKETTMDRDDSQTEDLALKSLMLEEVILEYSPFTRFFTFKWQDPAKRLEEIQSEIERMRAFKFEAGRLSPVRLLAPHLCAAMRASLWHVVVNALTSTRQLSPAPVRTHLRSSALT